MNHVKDNLPVEFLYHAQSRLGAQEFPMIFPMVSSRFPNLFISANLSKRFSAPPAR